MPIDLDVTIAPLVDAATEIPPTGEGEIIGPYRLVRWLGSGGMGTVWEAIEVATGRRVALKRLSSNVDSDESYVQRFVREAQLAAQISHPKVTFIYGSGNDNGHHYIAMELMPGKTLADRVEEEGPLSVPVSVDGILDVVEGLIAAHQLGVIHRDVKPANCFVATDDSVKIGDFGLSKSLLSNDVDLTQTGTFMGTPSYAAPEQIRAGDLDGRTDVYSVGATLYFLLTARTPFKGDAMSVTAQIITDKPVSTRTYNSEIPRDLDGVIAKCLEKRPEDRFLNLEQLKVALLPYASRQKSIADLGRRLAAFMIDQSMLQIVFNVVAVVWVFAATYVTQETIGIETRKQFLAAFQGGIISILFWKGMLSWLATVFYFAVSEGCLGWGLGKRLMGLQVVNREGQRAGFWKCLLRAFAVPGCFAVPLVLIFWNTSQSDMSFGSPGYFIFLLNRTAAYSLPILICISTMRVSNRLLGLHGMLSRTRVIRIYQGENKIHVPTVQPQLNSIEIVQLGPYKTRDLIGTSEHTRAYLGHDEQLNRDVWIVESDENCKPCDARIHLARVSRQRWLEGGELENGNRWDAFEAIHGVPIQMFIGAQRQVGWALFSQVMTELIDELQASMLDETLPETLSLPQIWLDRDGHAKLLDRLLVQLVAPCESSRFQDADTASSTQTGPIEKAVGLVQELGDLFYRTRVLPSSVQDFLVELNRRPRTEATLKWANETLGSLSKPIDNIRWDTRLGVLSATFGIELVIYSLISGCLFLACYYVLPIPNTLQFFTGIAAGLLLPIAFGFWCHGGPVFQVMGIQVCNANGRSANQIKSAIRSGLSWFPVIALLGAVILMMFDLEQNPGEFEPAMGSMSYELIHNDYLAISLRITAIVSSISLGIGLVFSILSPKRGLVDHVLGTRLMPK